MPYKAAVIGSGSRSHAHIDAYRHIDNAKVVACCGRTPEKRDTVAAQYGITAYADARAMIEKEKPDIVHIVTWPDTRVELMTLVSDMGVPLATTEKPLASGAADWKKLAALEARTKTKFAVCHQLRWHPNFLKCRDALASGKLGAVKFLDISAGMNIAGQGTHILDYGMALNGDSPVTQVFGTAYGFTNADKGHPAPDGSTACLTFENGVRALWNTGPTSPKTGDPKTTWQHVRTAAYAENGRVNFEEFGAWEIVSSSGNEHGNFGGMDMFKENNLRAQAGFHQAMFSWLEGGKPAGTNLAQSLHEWKAVLALYASALRRKPVDMKDFNPPDDILEQLIKIL